MRARKQHASDLEQQLADAQRRIAALELELETREIRDPLTGLLTLSAFSRHLDGEVDRCRRYRRPLAVAIVDVDGFRGVNASHGRDVGDNVLQAVGLILSQLTRSTDVVARSSADEFVMMLPETCGDEAMQAFERILLEFEALSVGPFDGVSVSVGVAEYERSMTTEKLLATAGERLDQARAAGGGRAELRGPDIKPSRQSAANGGAIAGLAEALVERDRYTGEHSESVVDLATSVARGLGLDETEVERVRAASLLHDIGKVAIPDDILNKAGPLDDDEWKIMREHPVIGERILRAIPGLGGVARIVRHEHERYDGKGYPDGLAGDAIPIGARIILACDAYHAMVSDRPYRKAMAHAEAVRELANGAGTQFDPNVTEILIGCLYGNRQIAVA
jgi:diguanylate cyclase (GGDEF)-like protein/putative nucleotidyltransferase with HDIG domain